MLTKLSVKNFRLLRDVSIDIEPGKPIVLIGPNGSGKSSVLQVLDLLGRWATDGFQKGLEAFGGMGALLTAAEAEVTIAVELQDLPTLRPVLPTRYGMTARANIKSEWLEEERHRVGYVNLLLRDFKNIIVHNERDNLDTGMTIGQDLPAHSTESELSLQLFKGSVNYPTLNRVRTELAGIEVYSGFLSAPRWAREMREGSLSPFDSAIVAPVPRIDRRGFDLVNALFHLQNNHHDVWEELVSAFRAEFPFVQRFEFPADPAGGKIALGWRDQRFPGVRMQGHQMSEGMTSYLCLLAALLCPEPAAAIAFDNPDAHLHPSAMRRLVYLLEKASERTAVFVATHSDRFLDFLSDPGGSLRVCEPKDGGVTVQSLNREALDEWRKDYSLAELRGRGHLDTANASTAEP